MLDAALADIDVRPASATTRIEGAARSQGYVVALGLRRSFQFGGLFVSTMAMAAWRHQDQAVSTLNSWPSRRA